MSYTLLLGDCLELLPTLEAGSVDAIIGDLPYGTTACSWDSVIPFAPMWEQVKRVLKPRGVFVTTASQPFTSALVMSNAEWFRYEWIWNKTLPNGFLDANKRPMRVHENVLVFSGCGVIYNPQMTKGQPYFIKRYHTTKIHNTYHPVSTENNGDRYPITIMDIPQKRVEDGHPTQKPVALYAYLIRTYTNPGDTVLDFTCGSGTTGVAAIKEGRRFVGIELDEGYHAIAQKRISEAAMQPMLLEVT